MTHGHVGKGPRATPIETAYRAPEPAGEPGKRTLVEALGTGAPLPNQVRAELERSFNADFSDVRVHQGERAAQLGARAFTQGADIHFAPGQYDPDSAEGKRLLGHELAHVVQQRSGHVAAPQGADSAINGDPGLEREADEQGGRAAAGEPARTDAAHSNPSAGAPAIQRMPFEFRGNKYDTDALEEVKKLCAKLAERGDREGLELLRVILQKPRKEGLDDPSVAAAIELVAEALRLLGMQSVTPQLFDPTDKAERGGPDTLTDELLAFRAAVDDRPSNEKGDANAQRFPPSFFAPSGEEQEMKPLLQSLPTRYGADENIKRMLQTPDAAHARSGGAPEGERTRATMQEAQEAMVGVAYAERRGSSGDQVKRAQDARGDVVVNDQPFDVKSPRDPRLPSSLPPDPRAVLEDKAKPKLPKVPGGGEDFKERYEKAKEEYDEETLAYGASKDRDKHTSEAHSAYVKHHDADRGAVSKQIGANQKQLGQDVGTIGKKLAETNNDVLLDQTYASPNYRKALDGKLAESKSTKDKRGQIHVVDLQLDEEYVREDQLARAQLAERYERAKASAIDPDAFEKEFHSERGAALRKQVYGVELDKKEESDDGEKEKEQGRGL